MKKTLIALAVVASTAVSGSAMAGLGAWEENSAGGSVSIGGTITVDDTPVWLVATGSGYTNFANNGTDLVNGNELSLPVQEAIPVLAIKTKGIYSADSYSKGVMPSVVVSGGDGIQISRTNWNNNGGFDFSVPVYADSQAVGTAKITDARVAGVMYGTPDSGDTGIKLVVSDNNNVSTSLYAGLVGGNHQATDIDTAEDILNQLGMSDLVSKLQGRVGQVTNWADQGWMQSLTPNEANSRFNIEKMSTAATGMGFGLVNGSKIDLTFTQKVTHTTNWSIPLNVTVAYN